MKQYYVYILLCSDYTYYVGQTNNLERRVNEHNDSRCKSTKSRLPVTLMYFKIFSSRSEAMKYEKSIKKLSRTAKAKLINETNSTT